MECSPWDVANRSQNWRLTLAVKPLACGESRNPVSGSYSSVIDLGIIKLLVKMIEKVNRVM